MLKSPRICDSKSGLIVTNTFSNLVNKQDHSVRPSGGRGGGVRTDRRMYGRTYGMVLHMCRDEKADAEKGRKRKFILVVNYMSDLHFFVLTFNHLSLLVGNIFENDHLGIFQW